MAEALKKEPTAEQHSFAAETARVLHLMIHALYTNRDIFLRELISNASDACDRLRYAAQTDGALLEGQPELAIRITADEKARTLTIDDSGIGMSHDELIANLGTIAKSGTSEFLGALSGDATKDVNLIGQFGVGFYSSFMVADRVTVDSRKAGEADAWRWESDGQGSYTITPAPARLRGTGITLHLKKDAKDYLDKHKLAHVVSTYSDHIGFPISLDTGEGEPRKLNEGSAIWARPKAEVTEAQYGQFYHSVAHSPDTPWLTLHLHAEGKTEYSALLFIPGMKPFDLFHPERRRRVKLYVKRVFITEEGVELIPPYLRFLRGVIDSADLPLNISRETLQKSPVLDKIRDSVTGRVLTELKKRAEKDPADYQKFWGNFGAVLKEGLCEGNAPREKILDACRFHSTFIPLPEREGLGEGPSAPAARDPHLSSPLQGEELVSLADYKSRMKEGQEAIYFLTGDRLDALRASPQIEGFIKRGIEVLLLTDHVDDFWPSVTMKYGELPFRSAVKSGADLEKFPLPEDGEKPEAKADDAAIGKLIAEMKSLYGDAVRDVRTTHKLADTPICLAVGEGDMDLRMERFLIEHKQLPKRAAKIVEINPAHPVIAALARRAGNGLDADAKEALLLLYDQALIAEGEAVPDAAGFARRLGHFLNRGLLN